MKKRTYFFLLFIVLLIGGLMFLSHYRVRDKIHQTLYDFSNPQKTVTTKAQLNKLLGSFEVISYSKLTQAYKDETLSNQAPFLNMLKSKTYYVIRGKDIYKKVVENYRIKHFLPKDKFYKSHVCSFGNSEGLYWLIDKRLLYKFLEFQQELIANGYSSNAFHVVNGYRHPKYNQAVGGASRSRHILGQAVDISIGDINKDGKANQADKKIVLEILDTKVIGNMGGLGLYPETMTVHFDVRGKRARWNWK